VTEAAVSALRMLADGRGHVLLVAPAGFGKTSTLRHLERSSRTLGLRTERYPVAAGTDRPDVVVVDDAHLLPAGELAVLGNRLASQSRVVAAVEPPPGDGSFGEALDRIAAAGTVVTLEPWTTDEVATLLDQTRDGDGDPRTEAAAVVSATGGLPWLVTELLAEDGSGAQGRPGHPTRPEREVLRVLGRLPRPVNEVVMALCAGYAVHRGPLPPPLATLDEAELGSLLDRVYDAGILSRDGQVPPVIRRAVLHHVPRHRIRPYLASVVDDLESAGAELGPLAADLVGAGVRDPRLVAVLVDRGDALLSEDPATSTRLYATAADGGGEVTRLSIRMAEALAVDGDLDAARTALADVSARHETPDPAGVRVAATVAVLSGELHQAASLCRWAAQGDRLAGDLDAAAVAAYVLYATGDADLAGGLLDRAGRSTPGLTESTVWALASAVRGTLGTDPAAALPPLVQRALTSGTGRRELLPDRVGTITALVALHAGDLAMADSVLARHTDSGESAVAPGPRHAALRAWTAMQAGQYADAQAYLDAVDPASLREQPWVWGLRVGLARRQDDVRALARLWVDARGVLVGHPVDLYSLLPLGEIGLAAARMHEPELAAPVWNRAMALLDRLGNPALWAPAFHWYGIQAAILTNRPHAMAPHATALLSAARTSPFAAALARAGRTWVAVLAGDVDPPAVEGAARGLASVGQRWEGARLAGHAAARASDRRDTAALMECARDLLATSSSGGARPAGPSPAESQAGVVQLSPREREVAELVLSGLTYRQIGESLYLSAKTVEHHMARIKRRSGAATRSELLERLSVSLA
jgi:DNA-binding CsgD family transcriptional regulator